MSFLFDLLLPGKLSEKPRYHGFPKFPQGQVPRQRHQPLPLRGEEASSNSLGGASEGTTKGGGHQCWDTGQKTKKSYLWYPNPRSMLWRCKVTEGIGVHTFEDRNRET